MSFSHQRAVAVWEEEVAAMPESTKLKKPRRKEEKMTIVMMSHLTQVCSSFHFSFECVWFFFLTYFLKMHSEVSVIMQEVLALQSFSGHSFTVKYTSTPTMQFIFQLPG